MEGDEQEGDEQCRLLDLRAGKEPAGAYAGRAQHGLALAADGAVGWSDILDGI